MCKDLYEKFLIVQISMSEVLEQTKAAMQQTSVDCSTAEKNINADVAQENTFLIQHQSDLAYSYKVVQQTTEQAGQKKVEYDALHKLMLDNREDCSTDLRHLEAEKCQLEKIRSEMFLRLSTNKDKAMFIDCEVDEWLSQGCNVTCGGGEETLTRTIKTNPMHGGVECPLLEAVQECNMHKCPVDCVESPWTAWSSCSAGCDGGVKLRTRDIEVHPKDLGKPCAAVTENVLCATKACNTDCTLADWSMWSPCSKECDSGHKHRIRVELTPQTGAGTCPDPWDDERIMEEVCNTDACPIINEKVVATCNKTADIVFLIDGSGSLGADAFADELTFASNFAKGFEKQDTTNFSVIVFSGPYTWGDFYRCLYSSDGMSKEVMKSTCGLEIVQHFNDPQTTQTTLAGISYPGGTTFTSGALLLAIAELGFARSGAEKIAILLTDGKPIDKWETKRKARELKEEKYRLVVVPIEGLGIKEKDVEYLKKDVSSLNHDDNTLIVEDWHELAEIAEASTLVEDVCR
jgi:hypothetical protein